MPQNKVEKVVFDWFLSEPWSEGVSDTLRIIIGEANAWKKLELYKKSLEEEREEENDEN